MWTQIAGLILTVTQVSGAIMGAPVMAETQNLHSPYYLEGYTVEQVMEYFDEAVLDTEFFTGDGDYTVVQKWVEPIRYRIIGEPTEKDLEVLEGLFVELNEVEGFPGISQAEEAESANLTLGFYGYDEFYEEFGEFVHYEPSDGAVQYWYWTDTNDIYEGRVGYRTDIDQYVRNSVLLEEIYNGLGTDDTVLREDSISWQYYNEVQEWTEMDWLIIRLMYHPDIKCGMNKEECNQVIKNLYY